MDIKALSQILKRAERMFRGIGASEQADTAKALSSALNEARNQAVAEYVREAKDKLLSPDLHELTGYQLAEKLSRISADEVAFQPFFEKLATKQFSKQKIFEIASAYTGASESAWSSKSAALKAIKAYFNQRAYLTAKAKMDEEVTPF